jgi:two-component system chemotaxis response regulator CheB
VECGGVLFRHEQDAILKFKCHIGHSYTTRDLMIRQSEEVENSLWYAVRSLEQRKNLLEGLVSKYSKIGSQTMVNTFRGNINEIETHIANLKGVIADSLKIPEVD